MVISKSLGRECINLYARASALPSQPHASVDISTQGYALRQAFLREDLLTCDALYLRSDEGRRNTVFITELRQIANYYMGGKTMSDENVGMSGLTASEASEFMRSYEKGMWTFVAIASAAHIAVWKWQPWFGM